MSVSKRCGKNRKTNIHGIEQTPHGEHSTYQLAQENTQLKQQIEELRETVAELQQHEVCSRAQMSDEVKDLMGTSNAMFHGPDTVEHFEEFSIDALIAECQQHAPDVFDLWKTLGRVDRHDSEADVHLAEAKAVMSLSALTKCRSNKVLGLQLLTSFMLIARSTSRQVGLCV